MINVGVSLLWKTALGGLFCVFSNVSQLIGTSHNSEHAPFQLKQHSCNSQQLMLLCLSLDSSSAFQNSKCPLFLQGKLHVLYNFCDRHSSTNFLILNQGGQTSALIRKSKCRTVVSTPGLYWRLQQDVRPHFVLSFGQLVSFSAAERRWIMKRCL